MKQLVLLFLCIFGSLRASDDIQQLLSEIAQVKPSVDSPTVSRTNYDQSIQSLASSCISKLKHYHSVRDFVLDATGSLYPDFSLHSVNHDLFHGLMGAQVYIVRSPRNSPIGVLKIYQNDFRQFAEEVWAFSHLRKIHCTTLRTPELYGVGVTRINNKRVLMTFQEYATGHSCDEMLRRYLKTGKGFSDLSFAYRLMGQALAELHQAKVGPRSPMHPIFQDSSEYYYQFAKKIFRKHPEYGVNVYQFSKKFQTLWNKIKQAEHHARYTHFDVHGGNYKVNLIDQQVWILDLEPAAYSISTSGDPIGVSALDYVQATEYLKSYRIQGLKKEDEKMLRKIFKKGYLSKKHKPSREEREFFAMLDALIYLEFYHTRIGNFSQEHKKQLKKIVHDRVIRAVKPGK